MKVAKSTCFTPYILIILLGVSFCTNAGAQEQPAISDSDACQTVKATIASTARLFLNRTNPARGESESQSFNVTGVTLTPTGFNFTPKYGKEIPFLYSDIATTMDAAKAYNNGRVWLFAQNNNWYLEFPTSGANSSSYGVASLISHPDAHAQAIEKTLTHFSVAIYHLVDLAHAGTPYDCSAPTMLQTTSVVAAPVAAAASKPTAPTAAAPTPTTSKVAAPAASAKPLPTLDEFKKETAKWRALSVKPPITDEVKKKRLLAEDALDHKNPRAAITYYQEGVVIDPTWAPGWYSVAMLYADIPDYFHAAYSLKRYLVLLPKAPNAAALNDKELLWEAKAEEAGQKLQ